MHPKRPLIDTAQRAGPTLRISDCIWHISSNKLKKKMFLRKKIEIGPFSRMKVGENISHFKRIF